MYHPSRGGVRGGRDQFNWDDVKADKHRENYLGHSLKAPVGRWQKGKDLMWYARDAKQTDEEAAASARAEIERVKQEEEEAMREALGLAPRRDKPRVNRLDKREQEELLKRTKAGEEADKPYAQGERIQGLGFAPVTKSVAPDTKDLLQRQALPEEERPLAQVISHAHSRVAEKEDQEFATEDDSRQVSDEIDKKRKRKDEKRAAKEQRREEKKATKKLRREKRRRHTSTSSDEELVDKKSSRTKHSRHESGSSDEERVHRKDPKPESHRNTRSRSNDDAGPHVSSKKTRASDESDEDMQDRPSGRKNESSRARDARSSHDEYRDEKKPFAEERDRNYSRVRDTSPRQRHSYDREEKERSDRGGRSYNREGGSSRRVDADEDHSRRERGGRDDDDLSRRGDRHYSERRHKRSPSPPRRRPRHDSD